ncbi:MAG TPA: cupin domain-containing protein [Nannocystis sp.]
MELQWLDETSGDEPTLADLAAVGVHYERVPIEDYQPALDRLRGERGYVTQDIVELRPDTPNLDALLAKFKDEHLHRDDEVRFVLEGEGIFDVRGADERWIRIRVERGDLIVVPALLYHRFFLTEQRQIRCVRLFKDAAGWVPEYRGRAAELSD